MGRWQKLTTLSMLAAMALLPFVLVEIATPQDYPVRVADTRTPSGTRWVASAPGKIEPRNGEFRVGSAAAGRIVDVLVRQGDVAAKGDMLVRLEDQELFARAAGLAAEIAQKKFARDDQNQTTRMRRRYEADDAVFAAEQRLFNARAALDRITAARRQRGGNSDDVTDARAQLRGAETEIEYARTTAADLRTAQGSPDPNANETALTIARNQLLALQAIIEQNRIRAPVDGTIIHSSAKVGEIAAPSSPDALMTIGDLTQLRVRTEVDGRDLAKVRNGQRAVVRVDAFDNMEFAGRVTAIAPGLMPGKLSPRGPRRPNDAEVLEVIVTLDGSPPLLPGLKVDVFFTDDQPASAGQRL